MPRFLKVGPIVLAMSIAALVGASAAQAIPGKTTLVSLSSEGEQGNAFSQVGSVSADGRFVTFVSDASTFVPGDLNFASDVFVRDRVNPHTTRVSVSSTGVEGDGSSFGGSLSADARFVAFGATSTNLVAGDTNDAADVFVHDRLTGVTERVSVSSIGGQANGSSFISSISADGRFVAFESDATNLVLGDTNFARDVFVHDRLTGDTTRVSVSSLGEQANGFSQTAELSADGGLVAFTSFARNLVADDTNFRPDVFVHDRATGMTERVSVSSTGGQGDGSSFAPSVSADGRYVAFASLATNFADGDTNSDADVFVRDRASGATERLSVSTTGAEGNGRSDLPSISADGTRVAFVSLANTLVENDTNDAQDVFLNDVTTGETQRVSVATRSPFEPGVEADGPSFDPAISADGQLIAFHSVASNLVARDHNGWGDVFAHDLAPIGPPG